MPEQATKTYPVTRLAMRPASTAEQCFYCEQPIGADHKADCVLIQKKVKLRMTIDFIAEVPKFWTKRDIELHRNEGSYCADNDLREIEQLSKSLGCLCPIASYEYVEDASEEYLDEK